MQTKIKTTKLWKNLKEKIKIRKQSENTTQKNNKVLLLNKNFINNQNYVLWKKQKINNIIYFLWYVKNTDSFTNLLFHKFRWIIFSIFRKISFSIKSALIMFLWFFLLLPIIYSFYFQFNLWILFIYLTICILPFIDYFKFNNYNSVKYKINKRWNKFSRFRKKTYWISDKYVVYNKKEKATILKFDLLLKSKIVNK